jgi:uncharacterized membrane protein YcaP (DUF421 family)
MTAASEFHSIGVLGISQLSSMAFEQFILGLLLGRTIQPVIWTAQLLLFPSFFTFYTQCLAAVSPDMFYYLSTSLLDTTCFRQA